MKSTHTDICDLACRLIDSVTLAKTRKTIDAMPGVPELQGCMLRGETPAKAQTIVAKRVIRILGPFTIKDATAIDETGFDVISDQAFINVPTLEQAERLLSHIEKGKNHVG
jgi:hypothetical protein